MSRLRILVLGAPFLNAAFRAAGHTVLSAGPESQHDIVVPHPMLKERLLEVLASKGFVPEVVLYLDNGNLPQFVGVEELNLPSLFYAIDTYCNPWHVPYANAFDGVLVAQKNYVNLFAKEHRTAWLPLFCSYLDTSSAPDVCVARDIPVSFVGTLHPKNIPSRWPFLQRFRAMHPLVVLQGDFVPVFSRSRIVLNQTAFSELNFRCFEAMGCGAALLMEDCADLGELFTPGVDILPVYPRGDAVAAAAIAAAWLRKPVRLAEVAAAGKALVAGRHTVEARACHVAILFEAMLQENAHHKRLASLLRRKRLLASAYAFIAEELNMTTMREYKIFYKSLFEGLL